MKKVTVVIPVFNEEKYLPDFLTSLYREIKKLPVKPHILFVNDGSVDGTAAILKKTGKYPRTDVLTIKTNRGKGHAMRTGSKRAIHNGAEYIIFMDGDGQHDPVHLKEFIEKLKQYPVVFGHRRLEKNTPAIRKIGNMISGLILRNVFRINRIGDVLCGFFAFRSEIFPVILWKSDDYGVEAEISTIISKTKIPFTEILVNTIYLDYAKGVNLFHAILILTRIPYWAFLRHIDQSAKFTVFLLLTAVFIILAGKDPFSSRTLIPNLEPYPDSLYYSVPAWNFIRHFDFSMQGFDYQSKIITPPLYSLFLVPFFSIAGGVRAFYFLNLILMILSLALFLKILSRLIYKKPFDIPIIGFVGFFFVTNFYFYTQPSLNMAESITLFFTLISVYLIMAPVTRIKSILAGFTGILLLLIKFSNLPISGAFTALYFIKILRESPVYRKNFLISFMLSALLFTAYIYLSGILTGHKNLSSNAGFSAGYFFTNFVYYLRVLTGGEGVYLWFRNPAITPVLAIPVIAGIVTGLSAPQWRIFTLQILSYILAVCGFMSFFYTTDIRYVMMLIPLLLLFIAFLLSKIYSFTGRKAGLLLLIFLWILYIFLPYSGQIPGESPILTYKKQAGLNFKHAEVPWNYLAVREFNSFFSESGRTGRYLGTFLPPYYVTLYANGNYKYLPITSNQEFYADKINAPNLYHTNLPEYYAALIKTGNEVYVSPYYQSNIRSWKTDYENLVTNFNVTLVKEGCHQTCSVYRLSLKRDK